MIPKSPPSYILQNLVIVKSSPFKFLDYVWIDGIRWNAMEWNGINKNSIIWICKN